MPLQIAVQSQATRPARLLLPDAARLPGPSRSNGRTHSARAYKNSSCATIGYCSPLHEKNFATIFQIETSTAVRVFQQAFHFLRSRDQIVHFGDLALREQLPAAERRSPLAKSVEEMPDLIHSKSSALGHIDDLQIIQDAG